VCVSLIAQQIRGALDRLRRPVRTLIVSVLPSEPPAKVQRYLRSVGLAGRVRCSRGRRRRSPGPGVSIA